MADKVKKPKKVKEKKVKKNKKTGEGVELSSFSDESAKKGGGFLFAIISLISALLVIAVVLLGCLFFVIKTNLMGVSDTYRDAIEKVPLINLALPQEEIESEPGNMTFEELVKKYETLESEKKALEVQEKKLLSDMEDLRKFQDEYNGLVIVNEEKTSALEKRVADLEAEKKMFEDRKYEVERLIAEGDKEGFAQYFETVSPEVAQEIYAQIVRGNQTNAEAKEFIKLYETMDTSASAEIFEQLGTERLDLIAETLRGMKRDIAVEILAGMSPEFAAAVTLRLAN